MTSAPENSPAEVSAEVCPTCKIRRLNYQAIGLAVFMSSVFSCGLLTFIAIPIGVVLQLLAFRKCASCRQKKKEANLQR